MLYIYKMRVSLFIKNDPSANIVAQTITFMEFEATTKNFKLECLLAEGGFGRV